MQIHLRSRDLKISPALREHVARSVHRFLGRYRSKVEGVTVRLTKSEAGASNCRFEVGIHGRTVSAEDRDPEVLKAIQRAAALVAQRAGRAIGRAAADSSED